MDRRKIGSFMCLKSSAFTGVVAGVSLVLAACGAPPSSANAQGTPQQVAATGPVDPFAGVSWQAPAGMKQSDQWDVPCPAACRMYQGASEDNLENWPLVIVHQPAEGTTDAYQQRWTRAYELHNEEKVEVARKFSEPVPGGAMTAIVAYTEEDSGRTRSASMLFIIERDGLLMPVEIAAFDADDFESRIGQAGALMESIVMDPAKAKASVQATNADIANKTSAIEKAYAGGGKTLLYMYTQSGMRTGYGLGGMQLEHYRNSTTYALLPSGVLLTELPDSLRKPDIAKAAASGEVGTWSKAGSGYTVRMPDGATKTLRAVDGGLNDGENHLNLIDPLSPAHLPERYGSASFSTAGGMAVGSETMIASSAEYGLRLARDGTFEQSRDSYTSASGGNFALGTGSDSAVTGRWNYDPAAYTLTLTPSDGSPPVTGPFFCYGCSKSDVRTANWDWNVLGSEKWWAENIED